MDQDLSEQHQIRVSKLEQSRLKAYPFPNDIRVDSSCIAFREKVESEAALEIEKRKISFVAGRIIAMRHMGKAAFCQLQDASGSLQFYIRKDDVEEETFLVFKDLDLGDIVEISGYAFLTKTGEPTLHVKSLRLLVKCLHPLPEKWHGLTDVEVRYRQRYLDLIVNPDAREIFKKRSKIVSYIRRFLEEREYLEVETPVMNSIASGAAARPFLTHHNALNIDLHLRIALELPLKKLAIQLTLTQPTPSG